MELARGNDMTEKKRAQGKKHNAAVIYVAHRRCDVIFSRQIRLPRLPLSGRSATHGQLASAGDFRAEATAGLSRSPVSPQRALG